MYKAVLFAPDGDWVTDFRGSPTIAAVEESLSEMGSRWIFYPFEFVAKDNNAGWSSGLEEIVSCPNDDYFLTGRTIKEASEYFSRLSGV